MYDNWSADWCLSRDPQERVDNETRHLRLDAATRVRGERRKRKEKWKSREEESFGGGEKKKGTEDHPRNTDSNCAPSPPCSSVHMNRSHRDPEDAESGARLSPMQLTFVQLRNDKKL